MSKLSENGFQLCDFDDGDCDFCHRRMKRIYFVSCSYEYPNEGDYYCQSCALKKIKSDEEFFEEFAEWAEANKCRL